jgi:hypothetical protein
MRIRTHPIPCTSTCLIQKQSLPSRSHSSDFGGPQKNLDHPLSRIHVASCGAYGGGDTPTPRRQREGWARCHAISMSGAGETMAGLWVAAELGRATVWQGDKQGGVVMEPTTWCGGGGLEWICNRLRQRAARYGPNFGLDLGQAAADALCNGGDGQDDGTSFTPPVGGTGRARRAPRPHKAPSWAAAHQVCLFYYYFLCFFFVILFENWFFTKKMKIWLKSKFQKTG